jgi:hypothetical protein
MVCAMCMCNSLMCLTFREPILEIRLKESGLEVWQVGLIFGIDTVMYTLTSIVLNYIPEDKKNFMKLVATG